VCTSLHTPLHRYKHFLAHTTSRSSSSIKYAYSLNQKHASYVVQYLGQHIFCGYNSGALRVQKLAESRVVLGNRLIHLVEGVKRMVVIVLESRNTKR